MADIELDEAVSGQRDRSRIAGVPSAIDIDDQLAVYRTNLRGWEGLPPGARVISSTSDGATELVAAPPDSAAWLRVDGSRRRGSA